MESQERDPNICGPVDFWKRSQPRPWCPVIGPDRKPFVRDQEIHGVSTVRSKIVADPKIFGSDLSRAHGAPFLVQIGSLLYAIGKFMESRKRDQTFCGPVFFWKRSQPRPWRPVIGPDRKPLVSDQKTHGVSNARSNTLRTCEILEASSAAPMVPRSWSRSEASCTRSENSWSLNRAIRQICGPVDFWKRSQPRPWRPVISSRSEAFCKRSEN